MRGIAMALTLGLVLAGQALAQQIALLGVSTTDPAAPAAPFAPASSRFAKVPRPLRDEMFRLMRAMLDHPGRTEEGSPASIADSNDSRAAYQQWVKLGQHRDTWPAYYFDHGMDGPARRIFLTCFVKLEADGVLPLLATFDQFDPNRPWPGFFVLPKEGATFPQDLAALGYGNTFNAKGDRTWGVRSPQTGCQLHFKCVRAGLDPRFTEMHLDVYNPGRPLPTTSLITTKNGVGTWIATSALAAGTAAINGKRALAHCAFDLPGNSIPGLSITLRDAVRSQGLAVPDLDEATFDRTVLSSFLKWQTDEPDWFGHLWISPEEGKAGWWTKKGGAQDFRSVAFSPTLTAGRPVRFVLSMPDGIVDLRIQDDGSCKATVLRRGMSEPDRFSGELVEGHVQAP